MSGLLSYTDAMARIQRLPLGALSSECSDHPLLDCLGRRLGQDLVAPLASPPFTNSAMDGYALRHGDWGTEPLKILGTSLAGEGMSSVPYEPLGCLKIMTGAPLPPWADTVVPVESTKITDDGKVEIKGPAARNAFVRHVGADFKQGTLLVKKGAWLRAEDLMVAASLGLGHLPIEEPLRILLISTGHELTEPGHPLKHGMIYNASGIFLRAAARRLDLKDVTHVTLGDQEDEVAAYLKAPLAEDQPTLILSTGAVSAGDADFIPRLAVRLGFETVFHKVAIRPGKPIYLGQRQNIYWLGLPGNPISTAVGWYFFARPLLSILAGVPEANRGVFTLANDVTKPEGFRCFYRAEVGSDGQRVWVTRQQGSAHYLPTVTMGAYVELPEGRSQFRAGETVYGVRL